MISVLHASVRVVEGCGEVATAAVLDSQSVKTTESGGPCGYDAGKKIKGRKRHVAVDTCGLPLVVRVQTGDTQDRDGTVAVIADLIGRMPSVTTVFADGAYSGAKLAGALASLASAPVLEIVQKPKGQQGLAVLPRRWVVERFFAWLGRCRRLSKDYERRLESVLAWLQLAILRILVRRLGRTECSMESVTC